MLDIVVKPPSELTLAERDAWAALADCHVEFGSPYFRPEFTEHVAAVRDDVEVAVLAADGVPVGFFPFQRLRGGSGRPVGGRLSDFHGVVIGPNVEWSLDALMRACGLRTWHFDHLLASQRPFAAHHCLVAESPYLDLSRGFEAYERERRTAGASDFKNALRKERKLHREHDVRFEWNADAELLEPLFVWKSRQYRRTEKTDVFSFDWTRALLKRLARADGDAFAGVLSASWIDGALAAVHFGIRSRTTLHYWFPAYDTAFEKHSPGLALQLAIARGSAERDLTRIDLGKGDERYKRQFASGAVRVAEGVVERSAIGGILRRRWRRTKQWVKRSRFSFAARSPARLLRGVRDGSEFA